MSGSEVISTPHGPPFRADHVGSLLRPARLIDARERSAAGVITSGERKRIEDDAIAEVVRLQEDLGLAAVTDGEFRRTQWNIDFLSSFANVEVVPGKVTVHFHTEDGDLERTPLALAVTGKLERRGPIFVDHFTYLKQVARALPKITIPSPTSMHFRGGRGAISRQAYPDMDEFYADLARVYNEEILDLAAAGCRYLQLDEVNFAYLCDPSLRAQVLENVGEDPETLPHTYARLINAALAGRPAEMAVCVHLCRGNFRGAWVADGGYEPVAEVLFNEIDVKGYFLEYDTARAGSFEPLRFVPKGKIVVLGIVSTKSSVLESKDELKRRIEEASRYLPLEQLALSPQCGFASAAEGNKLTLEDEMAKLRIVVETAHEIWGDA
jgi:5-methyltetrahydropteroyltriglutamate--homocysteine methyltransferase